MSPNINPSLFPRLLLGITCALFLAGCANLMGGGMSVGIVSFWIIAFVFSACTEGSSSVDNVQGTDITFSLQDAVEACDGACPGETTGSEDTLSIASDQLDNPDLMDVGESCDGEWETCCVAGNIDQCCCPEGVACNYGWFVDCGDGLCVTADGICPGEMADTTNSELTDIGASCDGQWEECCLDGDITECCCPEGAACNYGDFLTCGDGSCAPIEESCPMNSVDTKDSYDGDTLDIYDADIQDTTEQDTAEPQDLKDSDDSCSGSWQTCCIDGEVDKCCCPEGMACNFGWFNNCGDDTCVGMGQECPVDPPKQCDEDIDTDSPDVMWKACCIDGIVGECCCEGLAECNFGFPYTDCGEGTCTDYGDDCKPQF